MFFNRLGELRDRSYENQVYRANGLNLVVASTILRNAVYIDHAINALRRRGHSIPDALLPHVAPLSWERINLTGDYVWKPPADGKVVELRPLRLVPEYMAA